MKNKTEIHKYKDPESKKKFEHSMKYLVVWASKNPEYSSAERLLLSLGSVAHAQDPQTFVTTNEELKSKFLELIALLNDAAAKDPHRHNTYFRTAHRIIADFGTEIGSGVGCRSSWNHE